jgi:hypothetical protein
MMVTLQNPNAHIMKFSTMLRGLVIKDKGKINFIKPSKVMHRAQKARLVICKVR